MKDELTKERKQNTFITAELEKVKKKAAHNRGRAGSAQDEIGAERHSLCVTVSLTTWLGVCIVCALAACLDLGAMVDRYIEAAGG